MWRPSRRCSVVRTTQGKAPHLFKSARGPSRLFRRPPRIPRLQAQHRDCTAAEAEADDAFLGAFFLPAAFSSELDVTDSLGADGGLLAGEGVGLLAHGKWPK